MKRFTFFLLSIASLNLWSLSSRPALAQDSVQMIFEQEVAPELTANVTLVTNASSRPEAQASVKKAALHAREILDQLDSINPNEQKEQKSCLKGHLADVIMNDLQEAGYKDSFLELGGIFIAKGQDFNGPWKIPVVEKTTSNAQHAFYYKASNIAAATIEQENNAETEIKSVTVFTEAGACKAERLATAAVGVNMASAKKLLKDGGATRFVLIDQEGNFFNNP